MKATHIYIQERQKPFRYFCDDPVQETCKQFDFLKQPYLYRVIFLTGPPLNLLSVGR